MPTQTQQKSYLFKCKVNNSALKTNHPTNSEINNIATSDTIALIEAVEDMVRVVCKECGTMLQFNCLCSGKDITFFHVQKKGGDRKDKRQGSPVLLTKSRHCRWKCAKGRMQYVSFQQKHWGRYCLRSAWHHETGVPAPTPAPAAVLRARREHRGQSKRSKWDVMWQQIKWWWQ